VRKAYRKAALVVHPDKVRSRGGGPEEVAIADAVFDALKGAWAAFEAGDRK
jgi:curved DNA-binding protein CbpA